MAQEETLDWAEFWYYQGAVTLWGLYQGSVQWKFHENFSIFSKTEKYLQNKGKENELSESNI